MYILLAIIGALIEAFSKVLLVYCVLSWFIRDPFNKFMRILSSIVNPVLDPIREIVKRIPILNELPIDFAPLFLFFILEFIASLL